MKKLFILSISLLMLFGFAACSTSPAETPVVEEPVVEEPVVEEPVVEEPVVEEPVVEEPVVEEPATVEITDIHGTVEAPFKPERVISLDNRTFKTLEDWGITLVAAPKGVMGDTSSYVKDESVMDIGSHNEPNLEVIAAADPQLVIVGQRFARYYEDIKTLVPNAVVIDLSFDVSTESENPGEALVNGLKDSTIALGKIFDKNAEADKLVVDFDKSIADAKAAYDGESTIMTVIVSGGNIGFSAPGGGRVWGPMYGIFGWKSSLDIDNSTDDHQGDEINIEAIAQSNPDWIFVLDRDASISTADSVPAKDVIDNSPALQNVTAVKEGQIVYAPNDTYINESIQTYIKLFTDLAEALGK